MTTLTCDARPVEVTRVQTPSAEVRTARGKYNELIVERRDGARRSKLDRVLGEIHEVLAELERGDVDEHRAPAWETGCEFDDVGRGEAVSVDIYGLDLVSGQPLAVVQVRQFRRRTRRLYTSVRKNYFLVGRNEISAQPFAHPIPSRVVHAAVARDAGPASSVTAARAWIFEVTPAKLPRIQRHGDVALVPVPNPPAGERTTVSDGPAGVRILDAHVLQADEIVTVRGRTYARNPDLQHLREQHADVRGHGWYRVQVGLRADSWSFARPTAD